jgi:hypothetical protein
VGVIVYVGISVSDGIGVSDGKEVREGMRVGAEVANGLAGAQAANMINKKKAFIIDFIVLPSKNYTNKSTFPKHPQMT